MPSRARARNLASLISANNEAYHKPQRTGLESRTETELLDMLATHPSHVMRILADKEINKRRGLHDAERI